MSWWSKRVEAEALAEARASRVALEATANIYIAQFDRMMSSNSRLVDIIVELKREGFNPPPPPVPLGEQLPELPAEVLQAIAQRADSGTDLERQLMRWAAAQQGEPEAVARDILAGGLEPEGEE